MPSHPQVLIETPPRINVVRWADPVVEARGHRPGSAYVEGVWLSALGPATTLAWARLARLAAVRPASVVDTTDLAVSLGLGERLGRNAPISRTLARMVAFDAARRSGDTLAVRLALADLPERRVHRLSWSARMAHERWATSPSPRPAPAAEAAPVGVEL
ncbi:MAG: hypothetical protein ACRDZQ_04600 [Acidimicrobiales bacterium]